MRLFLQHVAFTLLGSTQNSCSMMARREPGWELQHRGTHDSGDLEDLCGKSPGS